VGQVAAADVPATITPAIAGRWQWIGTRTLRFDAAPGAVDRLHALSGRVRGSRGYRTRGAGRRRRRLGRAERSLGRCVERSEEDTRGERAGNNVMGTALAHAEF